LTPGYITEQIKNALVEYQNQRDTPGRKNVQNELRNMYREDVVEQSSFEKESFDDKVETAVDDYYNEPDTTERENSTEEVAKHSEENWYPSPEQLVTPTAATDSSIADKTAMEVDTVEFNPLNLNT
jgi:hypothetical protein